MAKLRVDTFLELVRSSKLIEEEQLERALADLKAQSAGEPITSANRVAIHLVDAKLLTQWQADKLLEGKYTGFNLGKYRLLDHLGSGGMSNVYLAEHTLMQRQVAIKVLPKKRVQDTSYLARFHREAQAAAALDDRNIVQAYDVDNIDNIHFLVMEYVKGEDLQAMVKRTGPLPYHVAADYIRQAALGLSHAHAIGLIHRDVKPANLLVDRSNVVKVLDLGLAKFSDEDKASLTVAYDENVLGTADYLAPEQALDSHGVDARADIYSLGCTFYYLLTGHAPFPDGTLPQRIMAHQKEPVPNVRKERPDAPIELIKIYNRMMAKRPQQRLQSAADVAHYLTRWLEVNGYEKTGESPAPGVGIPRTPAARQAKAVASRGGPGSRDGSSSAGSGPSSGAGRSGAGSGRGSGDTLSNKDPASTRGSRSHAGSRSGSRAGSRSGSRSGSRTFRTPKLEGRPPAEAQQLPQLRDPMQASMEDDQPPPFMAEDDSPGILQLRAKMSTRAAEPTVPLWAWILIACGALVLFLTLLILIL
ncbi:MAG: serine/threonine protein kinase [Pirellulales bacterium]|nr:serine/threonine protein kinase [Pirellulales bacterium]